MEHAHGFKKMWGRYDFFTIITFILQGCIKLTKFNSKTYNNITTDLYFFFFFFKNPEKCISFHNGFQHW